MSAIGAASDHSARGSLSQYRVACVCMPFAAADRPSIQLGLIGAIAEQAGFRADLYQFNLDLAARLTPDIYERVCQRRAHMTGEWMFAPAAFGVDAPSDDASYFEVFPEEFTWAETELGLGREYFSEVRHKILPAFVDDCLDQVDWSVYGVVGFSSLFQQNVASLALARRIKRCHPEVVIVFGGANMEGEMGEEYCRAFACIDYVISGEADDAFPALLRKISSGEAVTGVPGVIARGADGQTIGRQAPPVQNLDRLPVPNYRSYFRRAAELGLLDSYKATWTLPYESSRGCWWGQKHHCTFCGLNGEGMGFRFKTAERVLHELSSLAEEHQICSFMAVDNILPLRYIGDLFGEIERNRLDYNFFYEVKSNLSQEQIRALYHGGVRRVQPGIESLSSHVLSLMNKGCTMLQNVRCLKWCRYYGIGVNWNLIWGFPGEQPEDYEKQLHALKCLTHLEPPVGGGRIWLERFSPHYDDPGFPVSNKRAELSYEYVYPSYVDLMKAAYFFDYEMEDTLGSVVHTKTQAHLDFWRTTWSSDHRHSLTFRRTPNGILIDRNRGPEDQRTHQVTGANAAIYEFCTPTMRTPPQVAAHLEEQSPEYKFAVDEVRAALEEFSRAGLMLDEDDRYLGLALPLNPNW